MGLIEKACGWTGRLRGNGRLGAVVPSRRIRYLISPAGVPNFGDEFIARTWLRHLAETEPDSEVWLDCINPSHASVLLCGEHPHLHVTSTAWSLVWNAQDRLGMGEYEGQAELVSEWVRNLGTPKEDLGILKMLEADSIHLLGGGHVSGEWEANHALLPHIARVVQETSDGCVRLFATGLGLAPWDESDPRLALVRNSLGAFEHVGLRDARSIDLLEGLGEMTGDDAWLGLSVEHMGRTVFSDDGRDGMEAYRSRAYVDMQPCRSPLDEAQTVSQVVTTLLRSGIGVDEDITMVEAMTPEDSFYLKGLRDAWGGQVRLLPFATLWREGFPSGNDGTTVWVTSRYHMHLIGAMTGARGVAVMGGDDYYRTKHGALFHAGTGWEALSLGESSRDGESRACATRNDDFPGMARTLVSMKTHEAKSLYG